MSQAVIKHLKTARLAIRELENMVEGLSEAQANKRNLLLKRAWKESSKVVAHLQKLLGDAPEIEVEMDFDSEDEEVEQDINSEDEEMAEVDELEDEAVEDEAEGEDTEAEVEDGGAEDEPEDGTVKERPSTSISELAQDRFDTAFTRIGNVYCTSEDLVSLILGWDKGTHRTKEDAAFPFLYTAWVGGSSDYLEKTIKELVERTSDWDVALEPFSSVDEKPTLSDRLKSRDKAVIDISESNAVLLWVKSVVSTVNSLKFAADWNELTTERGGKRLKTAYRNTLFNDIKSDWIKDLQERIGGQLFTKLLNKEKNKFRTAHRKVIRSRNQALSLYRKFGATMIVHPVFHPTAGQNARGRSQSWARILQLILEDFQLKMEEQELLQHLIDEGELDGKKVEDEDSAYQLFIDNRHVAATEIICVVLTCVAGKVTSDWVREFLEGNTPQFDGQENLLDKHNE
ncbi:hypothetical protein BDQ12DRAFT_729662 [Crucibulum laeve]|uniref:Uncharacterized protein n=1 Tax=Crucibulum laeve TaxID=68775 RepID=A0A5C3LHD2_9AGAR|nr:hypothetical protein BDQ12DRAFT_729662 [Crucibulum laeve]